VSNPQYRHRRGPLALVVAPAPAPAPEPGPRVSFCGHCGARPSHQPRSRVCESCNFGILLEAREDLAPAEGQAFIVLDASLSVCAVSDGAEQLLAVQETDAVNRHVTELIVPADAEAQSTHNMAIAIMWAARGDEGPARVAVRPTNTFGVRLSATIATCGPPNAALLVFDTTFAR
jgi:hypothetical protein